MIDKIKIQLRPVEKDDCIQIVKSDGTFPIDESSRRMIIQKLHLQTDYFDEWPTDRTLEIFGVFELSAVYYRAQWNNAMNKDLWIPCTKGQYHAQMNSGVPGSAKKTIVVSDLHLAHNPEPGERSYYFKTN
jgi:hypothetical protein